MQNDKQESADKTVGSSDVLAMRLSGRCANGAERDSGALWHAIHNGHWAAMCGAKPGRRSAGWSSHIGTEITCRKCLRKLTANSVLDRIPHDERQ